MPCRLSLSNKFFYYSDNQPISAYQQQKQEDYSEEEEDCDDEEDVGPRGGRRKNKRNKKQKRRRKHGRRGRQAVSNPIQDQVPCVKKPAPRYVEQEDDKQPSAVEELLRLDREATMATVLKFDQLVGNALGTKELTN